jgi:DNA-binding transcriptional ArsR family regulator
MSDPKKEKYRQIRGSILKLLSHQHPGPLEIREILFLLDDLDLGVTQEELRSHLGYLEEKELVRSEQRIAGGIKREMIRITANGLNVLHEFAKDIGISIEKSLLFLEP